MAQHPGQSKSVTATVALTIRGKRFEMKIGVPAGNLLASEMLPMFRSVAESFVNMGIAEEEKAGRKVSCQKGCGACCRQLVPISAIEARLVAKVVASMPPERRATVLRRFADARAKLEEAEMLDPLLHPDLYSDEQTRAIGRDY